MVVMTVTAARARLYNLIDQAEATVNENIVRIIGS